jgi:ATP-dependent RNA helicase DDX43
VRRLAESYMKNPIQVYVGSLDLAATHSVTQTIELIDESEKEDKVSGVFQHEEKSQKLIR